MIFDPYAFGAGALSFALAFIAAGGFTLIFKALYRLITPHDEGALIRAGNSAAAVALGGAVLGYVIPLASALSQTHSLPGVRRLGDPGRRDPDRGVLDRAPRGAAGRLGPHRAGRDVHGALPDDDLDFGRHPECRLHDGVNP
jgi:hypothetical protein